MSVHLDGSLDLLDPPKLETAPPGAWRSRICQTFPGVGLDWLEGGPVSAGVASSSFADTVVVEARVPALRIGRSKRTSGLDLGYKLLLHLDGEAHYRHAGRTLEQRPGDLVLQDTALPFDATHPNGAHVIVWDLPRQALEPLLSRPIDGPGCLIERYGVGAVLGAYAKALARSQAWLRPSSARNLREHLCILAAEAVGASQVAPERSYAARRSVQRQRILSYIEGHFHDPRMNGAYAAGQLGMSRRWLHALLQDTGEGFSSRVTRRRLEESRRLLTDPRTASLSIAEVALLSGFNDVSTFHRRFRRAFGVTPADARRERN